ncbi:hypothetical protein PoB_004083700 [Plakobranchus ocellatus]|uniref:Retrotransposon gag domain-containing protein n=1 Tax=Plakobranchus ocellatus TaxID=259542 RepID=A0AAV4B495_9GAST|nr:hypothetical protein PoB_004083700 [Plakobranchus ocellatus]
MQDTIDLCNERNASFSWHEARLKKTNQHGSQNDDAGIGSSNYLDGDRRQHNSVRGSTDFRGDRHRRQPREDLRSRGPLDRSSARRGVDEGLSDYFDQDPVKGKRFVQPPQCLLYAGDSDWAAIHLRFERFAKEQVFCDQDAKNYLCWILVGKAAEYYTFLVRQDRVMTYTEFMTHMERRFAARHLRETALLRFQNARQHGDESIEEWADRIHPLALYAFEQVPCAGIWHWEKDQMILRFCTGCTGRAAGLMLLTCTRGLLTKPQRTSLSTSSTMPRCMVRERMVISRRPPFVRCSREMFMVVGVPQPMRTTADSMPSLRGPVLIHKNGPTRGPVLLHLNGPVGEAIHPAGTGRLRGSHKSGDTPCLPRGSGGTAMNGWVGLNPPAYARVLTDSSKDQYKKVQVLPHPHDLGYPLGYSKSFRCFASLYQVVNPNGLDPPCGMDSAPAYATSHRVVNPNSLDPPCGVDSALAASAPAFCEPESSQPPTVKSLTKEPGTSMPPQKQAIPVYTVPLFIGNTCVEATVDTAAEVSVVSDEVYRSLSPKPKILGKRQILMAGKGQSSTARLCGPVHIKIGPLSKQELIYVAPISDDMLLGLTCKITHSRCEVLTFTCTIQSKKLVLRSISTRIFTSLF